MANDVKDTASEISKMVPELYFDVICRIIPGFLFVIYIYLSEGKQLNQAKWQHWILGLFLAYIVGSVLDYFWDFATRPFAVHLCWWRVIRLNADYGEIKHLITEARATSCKGFRNKLNILETLRAKFRKENHSEKSVLTKIIAEERFIKNLFLILLLFGIMIVIGWAPQFIKDYWTNHQSAVIVVFIVAEFIIFCGAWIRIQRPVARAFFWWRK